MIIRKNVVVPMLILMLLFTTVFVSLNSMFLMPQEIMGNGDVYVLTSSQDKNPLRSNLNIELAYGLENTSYINAVSPEIFLFTTIKGQPVTLRGVEFSNFLKIENGEIVKGSMPRKLTDALGGIKIFNFLHLKIGEKITIYGSFQPSIAVINITGVFKTGGSADDELLVSLPTAQKLAGIRENQVSIIRFRTTDIEKTRELMNPAYPKFVVSVNSTGQVYTYDKFNATVTIKNLGTHGGMCHFTLNFENESIERELYVSNNVSFNVTLRAYIPGKQNINVSAENDVLHYASHTNILVVKNPVIMNGKILTYLQEPTQYTFLTRNSKKIDNATVIVKGENYTKIYHFNYSINITFPKVGKYNISFEKFGYSQRNFTVKVFRRVNLSSILQITPRPINNVLFVKRGEKVHFNASQNTRIYYSIDEGLIKIANDTIPLNPSIRGIHILNINAVKGWDMGNATFILHPYNSSQILAHLPFSDNTPVYYNSTYPITLWTQVPFENVTVKINNATFYPMKNYSFNPDDFNYTVSFPVKVEHSRLTLDIYAINFINRTLRVVVSPKVIYTSDVQKPVIVVGGREKSNQLRAAPALTVRIWSGESITVKAYDNVKVSNLTVYLFGNTYYSEPPDIEKITIPTMDIQNGEVYFMPEGVYNGTARATDPAGNVNVTYFEVIINNTDEKMPPIILGRKILNFDEHTSYPFKVFDNTLIQSIMVKIDNTTVISLNNISRGNYTLYLNSSQISDGFHRGYIYATDIYGNLRAFLITILKNYTDTTPPRIYIPKSTFWSGESILIMASDNTQVKKTSVQVFGKWFYGTTKVVIPTMDIENNSVSFIPPGTYTMKIFSEDIFNNGNYQEITITINNTGEKIPPVIILPSISICNATDILNFTAFDNVGVSELKLLVNNQTVAFSNSSILSVRAGKIGYGLVNGEIYAVDVNGNVAYITFRVFVKDNIPPEIGKTCIRMWSGNTTNITVGDNVEIKYAYLTIFGKTFWNFGNRIEIKTEFMSAQSVYFVPSGIYHGYIFAEDYAGNRNSSYVTIVINNTREKRAPVILGKVYDVISNNKSATFRAFDNVGVEKMWWVLNGKNKAIVKGNVLNITFSQIPVGIHNVTIYAEDVNGNVAHINVTIDVKGIPKVNIKLQVNEKEITTNQQAIITVEMSNGPNRGNYSATIYLDSSPYYTIKVNLIPYETKTITLKLPYLSSGTHKIRIKNETVEIEVKEIQIEKLPIDLLLKYDKNLNVTGGKNVIYKGFQISEGNFIILVYSLIGVGIILVALGMYSSLLKSLEDRNIAILRAIGASNRQIIKFALKDSIYFIFLPILAGIGTGYITLWILEKMEILRAFGHRLIIFTGPSIVGINILIGIAFSIFVMAVVFKDILSSKVITLFTGENTQKTMSLQEVLK